MRVLFTLCALWLGTALCAQEVFWTEDFGTGCNQGQVVSSYSGSNGAWTLANSGSNQTASNTFYVSAMENGNAPGECGSSCGNDRSLHVGNVFIDAILIQIPADQGASYYDSGAAGLCGFIDCSTTDKRAQSPLIDCTGYENIEVTFSYLEGGNGITDNAVLQYNTGSGWLVLQDLPKTTCCGGACNGTNQGLWSELTVTLPPEAADNPNLQLGIRWVNNDDGVGTDPSFAIDDIALSGTLIEAPACFGDFNLDGTIDTADLLLFLGDFGCEGLTCFADLNDDAIVNTTDLLLFLGVFGTNC